MGIVSGSKRGAHMCNVSLAVLIGVLWDNAINDNNIKTITFCQYFNWLHMNKTNASDSMMHRINKIIDMMDVCSNCDCKCSHL